MRLVRFVFLPGLGTGVLLSACSQSNTPTQPTTPPAAVQPAGDVALATGTAWTSRAPLPTGRMLLVGGVVDVATRPIVYTFGGVGVGDGDFDRTAVEAYDYSADTWVTKAQMPLKSTGANGAALIQGKFYLPGGYEDTGDGKERHPFLQVYDVATDSWSRKADMPLPSSEGEVGVIDGKLYVLAGRRNFQEDCADCGAPVPVRKLFRYNPASDTWSSRPWCPNYHAAGAGGVIAGKFYVAGGYGPNGAPTAALDIYNPVTNKWSAGAPMPTVRVGMAGAIVGGKLWVIGGEAGEVIAYDPVTNKWTGKPGLITPRSGLIAAKVRVDGNTHVLAIGGLTESGQENEAFTP
jgi:N-acetylneuraminic acid mutarotase